MQPELNRQQSNSTKSQQQSHILTTTKMTINNRIVHSEAINNSQNYHQSELKHHPSSAFYMPTSKGLPLSAEEPGLINCNVNEEDLPEAYNKYGKKMFKPVDLTSNDINNCKRFISNAMKTNFSSNKKLINKKYILDGKTKARNSSINLGRSVKMEIDPGESNDNNREGIFNRAILEHNNVKLESDQSRMNTLSRTADEVQIQEDEDDDVNNFKSDIRTTEAQYPIRLEMEVDIDRISPDIHDSSNVMDTSVGEENNENTMSQNELNACSLNHIQAKSSPTCRLESRDYSSAFREHLKRNMSHRQLDYSSDDEGRGDLSPHQHSNDNDLSRASPSPRPRGSMVTKDSNENSLHEQHPTIVNCLQTNHVQSSIYSSKIDSKINDKYDIVNLIKKENVNTQVDPRPISTPVSNNDRLTSSPVNVTSSPRSSPSLASSPAYSERVYESGDGETQPFFHPDSKSSRSLKFSVDNILDPNKFTGKGVPSLEASGAVADHMSIILGQNLLNSYKHLQSHWRPHLEFLSQQHHQDLNHQHSGKFITDPTISTLVCQFCLSDYLNTGLPVPY